jgi:bacteriocin biosynthesis cyclodehydratase domain-containing protein
MSMLRLRLGVEPFPASSGELYLVMPRPERDRVVRDAEPADVTLLAALAREAMTIDELAEELDRAGTPLALADLDRKLDDLRRSELLVERAAPRAPLDAHDRQRFDRQLPYFAEPDAAQRRIMQATVVVLGCGGLGTWALGALASAGVRRFTLIDDDAVELSNLNRQILYTASDLGQPKVACAADWLRRFEPRAEVREVRRRVEGPGDLARELAGADALVHAADWPPYEILRWADEACRAARVPYITAGQIPPVLKIGPTYVPGRSACFACHEHALRSEFPLYDELVRHRRAEAAAATTLGPASGVVGTLLAMEVMHLLAEDVRPATEGRALLIDMRTLQTRWETVERRPDCPACQDLVR